MNERSHLLNTNSPDAEGPGRVAMAVHDIVTQVSVAAVQSVSNNKVYALIVAMHAAVAGVHLLAKVAAGPDKAQDQLTSTQNLFAALLAYHSAPYETEPTKFYSEYSPLIINEALKDFEKLTGRQPDEELDADMCRVCRKFASDPAEVAKLNAQRAMALAGEDGRTLN